MRKTHPRQGHRVVVINARRRLSDQPHHGGRRRCGLPRSLLIVSLSYERRGDFLAVSTHRSLPHSLRQLFHTFLFKFLHPSSEVMLPFSNICRGPRVVVLFYCLRRWKRVMLVILTAATYNINVRPELAIWLINIWRIRKYQRQHNTDT